MTITELYLAMQGDDRLQKTWEQNQSRIDRAFEAPLIARTPREVATAALLIIKMQCLPSGCDYLGVNSDEDLVRFARSQGTGGARLANIIDGHTNANQAARAAAIHSMHYYRDRSADNTLVRAPWPESAIQQLAKADPSQLINPALRPTWSERKAQAVTEIARLLNAPDVRRGQANDLRDRLRLIKGLGPERADAVGVFAFHQPWPITDSYLWRILSRHDVIDNDSGDIKSYDSRRKVFSSHWGDLQKETQLDPNQLAATLYLWADEAERFGFNYC